MKSIEAAVWGLEHRLMILETNEPLSRALKKMEQAAAEFQQIVQIRRALRILRGQEKSFPFLPFLTKAQLRNN